MVYLARPGTITPFVLHYIWNDISTISKILNTRIGKNYQLAESCVCDNFYHLAHLSFILGFSFSFLWNLVLWLLQQKTHTHTYISPLVTGLMWASLFCTFMLHPLVQNNLLKFINVNLWSPPIWDWKSAIALLKLDQIILAYFKISGCCFFFHFYPPKSEC